MDASIYSPIRIKMPDGAPKIIRKEQLPDQRIIVPIPLRAIRDKNLTRPELRFLGVMCSYANRGGLLWASLERMAKDQEISKQRASQLSLSLQKKGYTRELYKGFKGERAATRQIIFKPDQTLAEVIRVSEEQAPYMVEQEAKRQEKARKKQGRPKKQQTDTEQQNNQSNDKPHSLEQSNLGGDREKLRELEGKVSEKVWQLAVSRAGNDQSLANIKSIINRLLR